MKNKFLIFTVLTGFLGFFSSCEKVIEIELEETETQIVIEANLQAGTHPFVVVISETAPYFEAELPESIEDAVVTLRDDAGNVFNVPHEQNGKYISTFEGIPGRTYTLEAEIEGVVYTAESTMQEKVELLEVFTEFEEAIGPRDEGYIFFFRFQDEPEAKNFYRLIHTVNDTVQLDGDDLQVVDDVAFDGGAARLPIFQKVFDLGDTVSIELLHLDESAFNYYNTLGNIIGGGSGPFGGSAAPGNPETNWSGGALGYFSAYSSDTASLVITE